MSVGVSPRPLTVEATTSPVVGSSTTELGANPLWMPPPRFGKRANPSEPSALMRATNPMPFASPTSVRLPCSDGITALG